MTARQHGTFSWNELMTTNMEASKRFYFELFDWSLEDSDIEGEPYTYIKSGGKEIGGMMELPDEFKDAGPYWGVYVTVDDLDATVSRAKELKAKIVVEPMEVPHGRFCVIQDPQGAIISAIQYSQG